MGSGASSREATALVRKWERAVDDLKALSSQNNNGAGAPQHQSGRRRSSGDRSVPDDTGSEALGETHRIGKHGDLMLGDAGSSVSSAMMSPVGASSTGAKGKVTKAHADAVKSERAAFYKSYTMTEEQKQSVAQLATTPAHHFPAAALALSSLLGGHRDEGERHTRVTVEDIFFAAEVPLTYLQQRSIELEELHSILQSFIDTDTRFRGNFELEVIHLDVIPSVGHVSRDENRYLGEHCLRVRQQQLSEAIREDLATGDAVYLVFFDPWIIDQQAKQRKASMRYHAPTPDGSTNPEEQMMTSQQLLQRTAKSNLKEFATNADLKDTNDGMVCTVSSMRTVVMDTVSIAEAALLEDTIGVNEVEIPFRVLYQAMSTESAASRRSRGFIRISKAAGAMDAPQPDEPVPAWWTHELLSGNVIGPLNGNAHARAVPATFAPHLVAAAWSLHLLEGGRKDHHGFGIGLPITDLIRTLKLPCGIYLDFDLPLDQVQMYLDEYLRAKNKSNNCNTELVPVITKEDRPGAVPSLTQHELDAVMLEIGDANDDPEHPSVVLMVQYDPAIAHNAIGFSNDKAGWGIVSGYDRDRQTARIVDANPTRFGKAWNAPCEWLLQAITGKGYIVVRNLDRLIRRHSMQLRGSVSLGESLRVGANHPGLAGSDDASSSESEVDDTIPKQPSGQPARLSGPPQGSAPQFAQHLSVGNTSGTGGGGGGANKRTVGALRSMPSGVMRRLDVAGKNRRGVFDATELFPTFVFPAVPIPPTALAAALTCLDTPTHIDDVLLQSKYPVNDLISSAIGLNSFSVVAEDYLLQAGKANEFEVRTIHAETEGQGEDMTQTVAGERKQRKNPALGNAVQLLELLQELIDDERSPDTAVVVHFSRRLINTAGGGHPFGTYGIITGIEEPMAGTTMVAVCDMHPNAFVRSWRVDIDTLWNALSKQSYGGARTRGLVVLHKLNRQEVDDRLQRQPAHARLLELPRTPVFAMFLATISPQIHALSIAFSQLGFSANPDEIFYGAYLKTVQAGTRRRSQAVAWRDVAVNFSMLRQTITSTLLAQIATKFLDSRQTKDIKVSTATRLTADDFGAELQRAADPSEPSILLLSYDVEVVHGLHGFGNTCALVQSYDPENQLVGLFDAEHAAFGLSFQVPLPVLIDACDRATGSSDGVFATVSITKVPIAADGEELPVGDDQEPPQIQGEFVNTGFSAFGE